MAKKSGVDSVVARMEEAKDHLEGLQEALIPDQEKLRKDPYNAELRARVQNAKRDIALAAGEYGELARAVSLVQGGTNHSPAP